MKWIGSLAVVFMLSACVQVASELPPLPPSDESRCKEFHQIAGDLTTTAYRRAAAAEQLRALRCAGHQ